MPEIQQSIQGTVSFLSATLLCFTSALASPLPCGPQRSIHSLLGQVCCNRLDADPLCATEHVYALVSVYSVFACALHHPVVCLQPLAYMCVHISLTTMTFALCKLWWASYYAHTAFLLFVFAISAWNGKPHYLAAVSPAADQGKEGVTTCFLSCYHD